jgi:hypothetical protein
MVSHPERCQLTPGVSKAFELLVEPDVDTVLIEEYTFPSSVNSARAKGARIQTVKIDNEGLVPEDLDRVLSNWDEAMGKRPHILYTIPCGQNPTGTVPSKERYAAVYHLAQKWDLIMWVSQVTELTTVSRTTRTIPSNTPTSSGPSCRLLPPARRTTTQPPWPRSSASTRGCKASCQSTPTGGCCELTPSARSTGRVSGL